MNLHVVKGARPIGLDIGSRVIKAAQLDAAGSRLLAAARIPRPDACGPNLGPEEAALLAGSLERLGFVGTDIIVAMHPSKVLSSVLDLPPASSGAPVADIARAELARIQKLDADCLDVGMWELPVGGRPKPGESPPAMVVACRREDTEAMLTPLDRVGLTCVRVDVTAPTLVRALSASRSHAASVVLDLGASASTALVLLGRTPIFERRVPDAGLSALFRQFTDTFGLDNDAIAHIVETVGCAPSEQSPGAAAASELVDSHALLIVRELKTSLAYVAHRYPDLAIGEIQVIGGGASIPGLVERISTESNIPARGAGWTDLGVAPSNRAEAPTHLTLAVGLGRVAAAAGREAA